MKRINYFRVYCISYALIYLRLLYFTYVNYLIDTVLSSNIDLLQNKALTFI